MRRALMILVVLALMLAAPLSAATAEGGVADPGAAVVAVFATVSATEGPAPETGFSAPPPAYAVVPPLLALSTRLERPPQA